MKRQEFIKLYADTVADGRNKHHPDMRPSEIAASRVDDERRAGRVWIKHRSAWTRMSAEQVRNTITGEAN